MLRFVCITTLSLLTSQEYCGGGSKEEAYAAIQATTERDAVVREVFQQMVNMRAAEVAKAVELLTALATDKLLTAEHFGSGIPLESMDDIAEDCPKVFESLAVVLSKVLWPLVHP